jgi:hypothetical protein
MNEVMERNINRDQIANWGTYDAIVIGGGISGVAAARTIAAEGQHVVLIEPTGTLGREITRTSNGFVRLADYGEQSTSLFEFYNCLRERKGWFDGELDPMVAGVALDDLLERYAVDVLFHVWPSRLLTDGRKVTGLEVACGSGRARLEAPKVIDASAHGKIGKAWFSTSLPESGQTRVHLLYNGIIGECPEEVVLTLPKAGKLHVACRPTYWKNEWRVTLSVNRQQSRAEWLLLLDEAMVSLKGWIPALQSGVLAHLSDDVCGDPGLRIATASTDSEVAGYVMNPHVESGASTSVASLIVPIVQGMLCNPEIADGLFLAGPWIAGYPSNPSLEEAAIINGFLLGDLVGGRAAL